MTWIDVFGYVACFSVIASFCMSTMLPLRYAAIFSNILCVSYGWLAGIYPVLILHCILLPLNLFKLAKIHSVLRCLRTAPAEELRIDPLLPYMRECRIPEGTVIFRAGDKADSLYYVADGEIEIKELALRRGPGAVFGEIGIFSPDHCRTATVVTLTPCRLFALSAEKARELYYQSPSFGHAVTVLIVGRLVENLRGVQKLAKAAKRSELTQQQV